MELIFPFNGEQLENSNGYHTHTIFRDLTTGSGGRWHLREGKQMIRDWWFSQIASISHFSGRAKSNWVEEQRGLEFVR